MNYWSAEHEEEELHSTGQKVSRFRDRFLRGDFPPKIVKTTMTANRSLEILRFLEYFDV